MGDAKWDTSKLNSGERSALKRDAGRMMGSNIQALEAFYRAVSYMPQGQERTAQLYACICLECLWKPEEHSTVKSMEQILRDLYQSSETSESIKHRIVALLDVPWSEDGYLLGKLANFVRMIRASNSSVIPDFQALADDLARWNHPDRYIQRRWIKTICSSNKDLSETKNEQNEEEESNNVD